VERDSYKLDSVITWMVTFVPLNLVSGNYPTFENGTLNMDVILCRNVTIYLDQETTRQIVTRFHSALKDDGCLVVGHAEPMASLYEGFVPRNFTNAVLYQKAALVETLPIVPMPVLQVDLPGVATPQVRRVFPAAESKSAREPTLTAELLTDTVDVYLQNARQAADHEQWDAA
jgi:chemotaxis protein methyltransferase CheR